jgi:hypothetical protein
MTPAPARPPDGPCGIPGCEEPRVIYQRRHPATYSDAPPHWIVWSICRRHQLEKSAATRRANQLLRKPAPPPTPIPAPRARRPVPAGGWPRLRFAVLQRDGFRCQACGRAATDGVPLHVDHKRPRSLGGTDDMDNLWTLCSPCNLGKGARVLARQEDDG